VARNFLAYPFSPYQGALSSKAFNDKRGQPKGLMVGLSIIWSLYRVGNQSLGTANPNFTVQANINAAGPNTVAQGWTIESVYIDNENVNFPVYVFFPSTGFAVSCPPNSGGWYQVFTLDRNALITGIGIPAIDIANNVRSNVFFTDAAMVPYLDQEQQTAVQFGLASPLITLGSGGGGLGSIGVVTSGSNFSSGSLSIVGGGGVGAAAHGTLDSFGRFTSVVIDNPGTGYSGFPVITPTGAQNLFAAWVSQDYAAGSTVVFLGTFWQALFSTFGSGNFPPNQTSIWSNTGISANTAASFNSTLLPATGGTAIAASSNYNPIACGDQSQNLLDTITAPGVFRNNLWGTPFSSGFIYLTNVFIAALSAGNCNWQLEDSLGNVVWQFDNNGLAGPQLELQRCNIKLPATSTWRLNCTGRTSNLLTSHGWAYTYAQI
jgi:hypothetical protein